MALNAKQVDEFNSLFAAELQLSRQDDNSNPSARRERPPGVIQIGRYLIVALTSARKIKSEGYLMHNCVRDYIARCMSGEYLLFSLRDQSGKRIATLGVEKRNERWNFDDCLGKNNSTVMQSVMESGDCHDTFSPEPTELFSVAHEVVRLLNCRNDTEASQMNK